MTRDYKENQRASRNPGLRPLRQKDDGHEVAPQDEDHKGGGAQGREEGDEEEREEISAALTNGRRPRARTLPAFFRGLSLEASGAVDRGREDNDRPGVVPIGERDGER